MIPLLITHELLQNFHACFDQLHNFDTEWPNGTLLTLPVLKRARELNLDYCWLARQLLSPTDNTIFDNTNDAMWRRYFNTNPDTYLSIGHQVLARESIVRADLRHLAQLLNVPTE